MPKTWLRLIPWSLPRGLGNCLAHGDRGPLHGFQQEGAQLFRLGNFPASWRHSVGLPGSRWPAMGSALQGGCLFFLLQSSRTSAALCRFRTSEGWKLSDLYLHSPPDATLINKVHYRTCCPGFRKGVFSLAAPAAVPMAAFTASRVARYYSLRRSPFPGPGSWAPAAPLLAHSPGWPARVPARLTER